MVKERGRRYVLSAEIKDLKSKFREASKIIRENASDLKKLNSSLKFDTHNMDALNAKWSRLKENIDATENQIKNISKQMSISKELGNIRQFERLKTSLVDAKTNLERLKNEFNEVSFAVKRSNLFKDVEKFSKEILSARENAKKLDDALRLDPKNITVMSAKLGEMKREFSSLNSLVEVYSKKLNTINPKLHPEKFRAFSSEMLKAKVEAEKLGNEIKSLATARLASNAKESIKSLSDTIDKSTSNAKELKKVLNFGDGVKSVRFEELKNAISKSYEKVKLLKNELKYIDVNVDREEFVRLNTEIAKTEHGISKLKAEMSTLDRIKSFGIGSTFDGTSNKLANLGSKMQEFGRNYTLGFTLPVVYGSKRVLDEFRDTDDGIRRVAAAGVSEMGGHFQNAFDIVHKSAKAVSSDSVFSIREVSSGMEQLVKAGWNVKDSTEQVAHVMNLAKVEGMELGLASEIVTDGLSSFGLATKDTQRFVDVLTQTAVDSTTDITKMGETFKYVSPIAGQLGFKIEDVGVAIGLMANKGIKASTAGTSLRGGLANLIKPSNQAKIALDAIGFSMVDSSGKTKSFATVINELREKTAHMTSTQKTAFATTVFGKTAMSGWTAILNSTDAEVKKLTDSINNSNGATKKMADQINGGVGGAIDRFKSKVSNASDSIGRTFEPAISGTLGVLGKMVDGLANASDETKVFVGSVTTVATVIPVLSLGIGSVLKLIPTLKTGLTGLKTALLAFTSPVGLATTATFVLGGAFAYGLNELHKSTDHYKRHKSIMDSYSSSVDSLSDKSTRLSEIIRKQNEIVSSAGNSFDKLLPRNSDIANELDVFSNKMESISSKLSNLVSDFVEGAIALDESHVALVSTLNNEFSSLYSDRISIHNNLADKLTSQAITLNKAIGLSDDEYLKNKTELVNGVSSLREAMLKNEEEWYFEQVRLLQLGLNTEFKTNEDLARAYLERKESAEKTSKEILDIINKEAEERLKFNTKITDDLKLHKKSFEEEERRHNSEVARIKEERKTVGGQMSAELEAEERIHAENMAKNNQMIIDSYNKLKDEDLAKWLQLIKSQIENGGTLTQKQMEFVESFVGTVDNLPQDVKERFENMFKEAGLTIDTMKEVVNEKMRASGRASIESLALGIDELKGVPVKSVDSIMFDVKSKVDNTASLDAGSSLIDRLNLGISNKSKQPVNSVNSIMDDSKRKIDNTTFSESGNKAMDKLKTGINDKKYSVGETAKGVAENAKTSAGSVDFSPIGNGMGSGMQRGIWSKKNDVINAAWSVAQAAYNTIRNKLGINSPSRLFKKGVGFSIPEGLAVGILEKSNLVRKSGISMVDDLYSSVKDRQSSFGNILTANLDYSIGTNSSVEHEFNNVVVNSLNNVVDRLNNLELKSNVYLDSKKVGEITYKEHLEIDRRFGYL